MIYIFKFFISFVELKCVCSIEQRLARVSHLRICEKSDTSFAHFEAVRDVVVEMSWGFPFNSQIFSCGNRAMTMSSLDHAMLSLFNTKTHPKKYNFSHSLPSSTHKTSPQRNFLLIKQSFFSSTTTQQHHSTQTGEENY